MRISDWSSDVGSSDLACRAFYWLHDQDPAQAVTLARALYREAFGRGGEIASGEAVLRVAESAGAGRTDEMAVALNDAAVKQRLRDEVSRAISKGAFRSEGRRVGNDGVSPEWSRWAPRH